MRLLSIFLIIVLLCTSICVFAEGDTVIVNDVYEIECIIVDKETYLNVMQLSDKINLRGYWDFETYIIPGKGKFTANMNGVKIKDNTIYMSIPFLASFLNLTCTEKDGKLYVEIKDDDVLDIGGPPVKDPGGYGRPLVDFGISGPEDMPKIDGCTDEHDALLYYAGVATGIDPVLLKVIMKFETGGKPRKSGPEKDGTYNYGLMQINDVHLSQFGVSAEEMNSNNLLNVWAATEVLKGKYKSIKNREGEKDKGAEVKMDSFSLFWFYGSYNKAGLKLHAYKRDPVYTKVTKLPKTVPRKELGIEDIPVLKNILGTYKSVALDDLMVNTESMSYDEFVEVVDLLSNGELTPEKYTGGNTSIGDTSYNVNIPKDESYSTGVGDRVTQLDSLINYSIYSCVEKIVKGLNALISVLVIFATLYLIFIWIIWILGRVGVTVGNTILLRLSSGILDVNAENSMVLIAKITVIDIFLLALVLSGLFLKILQSIFINLMLIFG